MPQGLKCKINHTSSFFEAGENSQKILFLGGWFPLTQLFPHDRALPAFIWLLFNLRFHGLNNFTGFTFLSHLYCVFSHLSLDFLPVRIRTYIWWAFCRCGFQMCLQKTSPRGCMVTLIAFVWLFFTLCFWRSPYIAWVRGCIVTMVTLIWFFSAVYF